MCWQPSRTPCAVLSRNANAADAPPLAAVMTRARNCALQRRRARPSALQVRWQPRWPIGLNSSAGAVTACPPPDSSCGLPVRSVAKMPLRLGFFRSKRRYRRVFFCFFFIQCVFSSFFTKKNVLAHHFV